jgi:hypothetical protein
MLELKITKQLWTVAAVASLMLAFGSSKALAVGVAEPEDAVPADEVQADEMTAEEVAPEDDRPRRGRRGRRGIGGRGFGGPGDGLMDGHKGPRGRRGPGVGMRWQKMSEEEREDVKAFIAEHFPEVSEAIEAIDSEEGLAGLDRKRARMLPEIMRLHRLSQDDPELFEVKLGEHKSRFELRRLVREYRQAEDEATKEELSTQIKPLVEAAFDAKQSRMEEEVTRLEKRMGHLRDQIAKRAENRDAEIEKAFNAVLEGKRLEGERKGKKGKRGKRFRQRDRQQAEVEVEAAESE